MRWSAVYVISKLTVLHNKHTDVSHRTQIHKLSDFVLNESLPDKREEQPLKYSLERE